MQSLARHKDLMMDVTDSICVFSLGLFFLYKIVSQWANPHPCSKSSLIQHDLHSVSYGPIFSETGDKSRVCYGLCVDKSCVSVPFPAPPFGLSLDTAQWVYTWSCLSETWLHWDFLWPESDNAFLHCITVTLLWCCKQHGMHFWLLKTVQIRIVDCHQMAPLGKI